MKKLITLLLVLTGMVSTASAAKLYVYLKTESQSFLSSNPRIMAHLWNGESSDVKDVEMTKDVKYGEIWYSCDLDGRTKAIIVRQNRSYGTSTQIEWNTNDNTDKVWNQTDAITDLSTTADTYGELWYNSSEGKFGVWTGTSKTPRTAWSGLCIRSSKDGWDNYESNTVQNGNTFTRTYTKADVTSVVSAGGKFYFRFRHVDAVDYDETEACRSGEWTQIQVEDDTELPFGTSTTGTFKQDWKEGGSSWYFTVPSYDFEKVVITAEYVYYGGGYKWQISTDAYITKTVSGANKYATFGCPVPLEVEESFVPAWTLTADAASGKITKKMQVSMIPAGQGVLLVNESGSDRTVRYKVYSSDFSFGDNDLVATDPTTLHVGQVTETGYTNYILAKEGSHVGFYKVNGTSGNDMGANTAYLHVADAEGARSFFALDDSESVTAINAVDQNANANGDFFNIAGQRVAQPTKGLYIVNGKKVIIK